MLYLREIGFGFGKSYTFAGLVAADYVRSPDQLVAVLDDVSKRQGELATFSAWAPELEGDRFTLAMRALFTVATASNSGTLSDAERNLSNPIMFDVSVALQHPVAGPQRGGRGAQLVIAVDAPGPLELPLELTGYAHAGKAEVRGSGHDGSIVESRVSAADTAVPLPAGGFRS